VSESVHRPATQVPQLSVQPIALELPRVSLLLRPELLLLLRPESMQLPKACQTPRKQITRAVAIVGISYCFLKCVLLVFRAGLLPCHHTLFKSLNTLCLLLLLETASYLHLKASLLHSVVPR
jgi:hypothetical protein